MSNGKFHFVYVMAAIEGGVPVAPCKIGVSHHPNARLVSVQTGSHKKLEVVSAVAMPSRGLAEALERELHDHFGDLRLSGEWFDVSPIDAAIGACCWAKLILEEMKLSQDEVETILDRFGINRAIDDAYAFIERCQAERLPLQSRIAAGRANREGA